MDAGMIVLSLILTLLGYCLFPLIYANSIDKPITEKKYRRLCWSFNLIPMCIFIAINPGNGAPYLLWTAIFTRSGLKTLRSKGLLLENEESNQTNDEVIKTNNGECENKESNSTSDL